MRIALFLAVLAVPSTGWSQQCLHGPDESASNKERRTLAVKAARFVNTAQARHQAKTGRYVQADDLLTSAEVAELKSGPTGQGLSLATPTAIVEGFELRLTTDGRAYSFSLRDKADPCGFGYFSDDSGVIFQAYPIQPSGVVVLPPK